LVAQAEGPTGPVLQKMRRKVLPPIKKNAHKKIPPVKTGRIQILLKQE